MEIDNFESAVTQKEDAVKEMERIAFNNLQQVSEQYTKVFGTKMGLCKLAEDLCCKIAVNLDDGAWSRILHHVKKISG